MSPVRPDNFAPHLRRDDALSEHYRASGAQDVPDALSQRILAEAQAAVARPPGKASSLWRWLFPEWNRRAAGGLASIAVMAGIAALAVSWQDYQAPAIRATATDPSAAQGISRPVTELDRAECVPRIALVAPGTATELRSEVLRLDAMQCPTTARSAFLAYSQQHLLADGNAPQDASARTGDLVCPLEVPEFRKLPEAEQRSMIFSLQTRGCIDAARRLAERYREEHAAAGLAPRG